MRPITVIALIFKLFLLQHSFWLINTERYSIKETLRLYEAEYKFDLIILIKFGFYSNTTDLEEVLQRHSKPLLILNDLNLKITPIYNRTSSHCLSVVCMAEENEEKLLNFLDNILWKRHLSHIFIIWQYKKLSANLMEKLFKGFWLKGMTNVLLWFESKLYSYKPYPVLKIVSMEKFAAYIQRPYLTNFKGFNFYTIFVQYPPRCFSYNDRHGQLRYSGTFFKINQLFAQHYNGNLLISLKKDMWSSNISQMDIHTMLSNTKYDLLSSILIRDEFYASSDVLWLLKRYLIVPTSREIQQQLYILKTFSLTTWLMIILLFFVVLGLIYLANKWHDKRFKRNFHESYLLQALAIVNSLPYNGQLKLNALFNFLILMLNLCAGFMLVNFFNCNLSSLLVTKLYEPELKTLEDIGRTSLYIYEYSLDAATYKDYDLPPIILQRLKSDNNTYLLYNRKRLNVHLHIFSALEDVANYYLLQQRYLKPPKAKLLDEPTFISTFFIILRHRAPFFDHFNRYLLYLKESGIIHTIIADSEWNGISSGDIDFFNDPEPNKSLTLEHLLVAFYVLVTGLVIAMVAFLLEIYVAKKKK